MKVCSDTQGIALRAVRLSDLDFVVDIEKGTPSPWSVSSLEREIRFEGGLAFVADDAIGGIVGWCCSRVVGPEAELLKIAVAPETRRMGIGFLLLKKMLRELQKIQCETLFLEVREKNRPALGLYGKNDFYQVGLRCNYYRNPPDNALIFRRDIQKPAETHDATGLK